jgi:uncharacterized protein YfaS (alpha-2-macroglobulin family)
MTIFLGETVRIQNTMKDYDGSPLTPDSQEVKIYDPNGVLKATYTSPVKEADGVYHIDHTTSESDSAGEWTCVWKVIKNDIVSIEAYTFQVRKLV